MATQEEKKWSLKGAGFTRKRIIWIVAILVIGGFIGYRIYAAKNAPPDVMTEKVERRDLIRTVLATGQVTSATDLALSFKVSGIVKQLNVTEGSVVKKGNVLASLDNKDQQAQVVQARGSVAEAEANYQKIFDGVRSEEINVAEAVVASAETTIQNAEEDLTNTTAKQKVLVASAYAKLLNTSFEAIPLQAVSSITPTISGTYTGTEAGEYIVRIPGGGSYYEVTGLETDNGVLKADFPLVLGTRGLFIKFSSIAVTQGDSWKVEIPNTRASGYITNLNAYNEAKETQRMTIAAAEAAVRTAVSALEKAKADLTLKKSKARPAELAAAQAVILTAKGRLQAALAALENTILRAPAAGTITSVDIKLGELARALEPVIVLQDIGRLHVEANLSEANIALLEHGQLIDMTFDSLGPDRHVAATVESIDPASTVIGGVVNYRIIAAFDPIPDIKPGMTANMAIEVAKKPGALAVPARAVIQTDGQKKVRVITDPVKKAYEEREVSIGIEADGGLVEIIEGVKEGDEVVTFVGEKK